MEQEFISQTALDQMVVSDRDQMLKAAVPYLPPQGQRILSVYEKARELQNTISLFSGGGKEHGVSMCAAAEPMEAINDIRRFCYGESRNMLDRMVNMMAVVEMMRVMNNPAEKEQSI